jgi:hypothetical protein
VTDTFLVYLAGPKDAVVVAIEPGEAGDARRREHLHRGARRKYPVEIDEFSTYAKALNGARVAVARWPRRGSVRSYGCPSN